ncbi:unnamed protein product, partial [Urochloa humidicola]
SPPRKGQAEGNNALSSSFFPSQATARSRSRNQATAPNRSDNPSFSRSALPPGAMAIRSPSSTPRWDLDSSPVDSPSPTSQGGSGKGDVARKMMKEVEHVLANLENEGVEIDGKIAGIIDGEMARIKAEAAREKITGLKRKGMMVLLAISSAVFGFLMGSGLSEQAIYAEVGRRVIYGEI